MSLVNTPDGPEPAAPSVERQRQARDWFTRLRADDCSDAERQAFAQWQADALNQRAYVQVVELWALLEAPAHAVRQAQSASLLAMAQDRRPRRVRRAAYAAAASLLMATGLVLALAPPVTTWGSDYVTASGQQRSLTLSDGSTLLLDSDTAVDIDFSGTQRLIRLRQGRAFFDIVHDGRSLLVESGTTRVRVLGTAFSVEHRRGEDQVLLLRGSVEVESAGLKRLLAPGQGLSLKGQQFGPVQSLDAARLLAWREGQLRVREEPLRQVLQALVGYRGGHVLWLDERLAARPVSGSFNLRDPDSAIDALIASQGLQAVFNSRRLLILR